MKTNDLLRKIESIISNKKAKSYNEEADLSAEYPYSVFSLRVYDLGVPAIGTLEVNVWDSYKSYARVDDVMDDIEETVNDQVFADQDFILRMYKGQRNHIVDSDRNIKRVREQFEIRIAERK